MHICISRLFLQKQQLCRAKCTADVDFRRLDALRVFGDALSAVQRSQTLHSKSDFALPVGRRKTGASLLLVRESSLGSHSREPTPAPAEWMRMKHSVVTEGEIPITVCDEWFHLLRSAQTSFLTSLLNY